MLKHLSAFVLVSVFLSACGDAGSVEPSEHEGVDETVELAAKPPSCPYSSQCPSNPIGYTFAYWYDQSFYGYVQCFYRKNTYPYNFQLVNATDGGCGGPASECCPTGTAAPCANGPNPFKFYTCY